jgi:hypothetical protein
MLLAELEEVSAAVKRPGALARERPGEVTGAVRTGALAAGDIRGAVEAASERMEGSSVDMGKNARRQEGVEQQAASEASSRRNNNRSQRAQGRRQRRQQQLTRRV